MTFRTARILGVLGGAAVMLVVVTVTFAALACALVGARAVSAIRLAIPFAATLGVINLLRSRKVLLEYIRDGEPQ